MLRPLQFLAQCEKRCPRAVGAALVEIDQRPNVERHPPGTGGLSHLLDGGAALPDRVLCEVPCAGVEVRQGTVSESFGAPAFLAAIAVPLVLEPVAGACCVGLVHAREPDEADPVPLDLGPRALFEEERSLDEIVPCATTELGAEERLVKSAVASSAGSSRSSRSSTAASACSSTRAWSIK